MAFFEFKINDEGKKTRLDVFLTEHLTEAPSRTFIKRLIDNGHVKVNESIRKTNYKVETGDDVHVTIPDDFLTPQYVAPEKIDLDIFYEDEYLIIINKPNGMTVHPSPTSKKGTLVNALLNYSVNLSQINSAMRPGIVHRLDKETSGLLIIAKDNITHTKLAKQFQRHTVQKRYVALVEGAVEFDEGKIDVPLGKHPRYHEKRAVLFDDSAKESVTFYKVLKRFSNVTLVELMPKTGRTHQLRVHMAHLGHSILGDDKYGKKKSFSRLALHARSIGFLHPQNKKYVEFNCCPPKELLTEFT